MSIAAGTGERRRAAVLPSLSAVTAGTGRPVVLVHGFPSDGRVFAGQLAAARSGEVPARVIAVDLPGFGRTPAPSPPVDVLEVPALVDSLVAWLEAAGIERAVVGGLAIGAYLAIELAAIHPDRVSGLVLIGAKPEPDAPANAERREAVARLALDSGATAVADALADEPFSPRAGSNPRRRFRRMIEDAEPAAIAALVRGLHRRPDPKPALAVIAQRRLPALVLVGADDPFSKPADARRLADLLPGASFEMVPGAGHLPPLERPAAVNGALRRFLDTLQEQPAR